MLIVIILLLVVGLPITALIGFLIWRTVQRDTPADQVVEGMPPPPGEGLDV